MGARAGGDVGRGAAVVLLAVLPVVLPAVLLAGCASSPDRARGLEADLARLDQVATAEVTAPAEGRVATITVTYDVGADDPAALAALVAGVGELAGGADHAADYAAYRLRLVPVLEPDSALVVPDDFAGTGSGRPVLEAWLREVDALLGPVTHVVDDGDQVVTVETGGGLAHDLEAARRIRSRGALTWVFDTGAGTVSIDGRVEAADLRLVRGVQRAAGTDRSPVWAERWSLDRREGHVRLDLGLALGTPVPRAELTASRYGRLVAPLVRPQLGALKSAGLPVWLRLLEPSSGQVLGSWSSETAAEPGRDPLARGWDEWLAAQPAGSAT